MADLTKEQLVYEVKSALDIASSVRGVLRERYGPGNAMVRVLLSATDYLVDAIGVMERELGVKD